MPKYCTNCAEKVENPDNPLLYRDIYGGIACARCTIAYQREPKEESK